MSANRSAIVAYLNELLNIPGIPDSSCNGLQVQGTDDIITIGLAVDACMSSYKKAIDAQCQMLLVHHGLIWGGLKSVTGNIYRHIHFLISTGLNLYAAHLPLDMHPDCGNNIALSNILGIVEPRPFGLYKGLSLGFEGSLPEALSSEKIGRRLQEACGGQFSILPFGKEVNRTVAIVSGGGSSTMAEAIEKNIDCFITGEPTHWNHHRALEAHINVVYSGHYHTETVGVKELGARLQKQFDVSAVFLDEPTLV